MSLETLKASTLGSLSDKVALIAGGGTGLWVASLHSQNQVQHYMTRWFSGLMIAKTSLANGATKVCITSRCLEVLQKAAEAFQGLVPLQMDITSKESIASAVKIVLENDGKLDVLVNKSAPLPIETRNIYSLLKSTGIIGQPVFTGEAIDTTRSYGQAFFDDESFER
ncbi:short chain dehydrogenase reductase family protein [Moniliophthora roreri]|nr:short chain dehydrogenase reductase family protein [Moniliophthora roreri]